MRKLFDEQLLQVRGMLKEMCEVDAEAMRLMSPPPSAPAKERRTRKSAR